MDERIVEDVGVTGFHCGIFLVQMGVQVLVAEGDEIGERCGVGIPVAAAFVFQEGYLDGWLGNKGVEPKERDDYKPVFHFIHFNRRGHKVIVYSLFFLFHSY
jgi:hypothetical protein